MTTISTLKFQVYSVDFDFETDYDKQSISESEKAKVISQTIGVWEAEDEDHLIELISDESGWLVEDLAYETLNE